MSHLSRRYTEHYYVEGKKGKLEKRDVLHTNSPRYLAMLRNKGVFVPPVINGNGVFPCQHEDRDFLPKKPKRSNHTHARNKRKFKARNKARKAA